MAEKNNYMYSEMKYHTASTTLNQCTLGIYWQVLRWIPLNVRAISEKIFY